MSFQVMLAFFALFAIVVTAVGGTLWRSRTSAAPEGADTPASMAVRVLVVFGVVLVLGIALAILVLHQLNWA